MTSTGRAPAVARRRAAALAVSAAVPVALVTLLDHRGVHAVRSLLVPGAGLYDEHLALGLACTLAAVLATVAWLRWGTDWLLLAVVLGSCVVAAALATPDHVVALVRPSAHEFPLVVLVVMALSWVRLTGARYGLHWPARTRARLSPVDRCRAVAIAALAGAPGPDAGFPGADVRRRAERVGLVARGRRGGDPYRVDHAHARAALALTGRLDAPALARLADDARRSVAGVPASEPGLVRLLDATLAAAALDRLGDGAAGARWTQALRDRFPLRRGHRPACLWTPLAVPLAHADPWEQAAATAVAHAAGWCGAADWDALRQTTLGAAARGSGRTADERLIAAGRVWTTLVDDEPARRLLARPTVGRDPLAAALDALARHYADTRPRAAHAATALAGGTP